MNEEQAEFEQLNFYDFTTFNKFSVIMFSISNRHEYDECRAIFPLDKF